MRKLLVLLVLFLMAGLTTASSAGPVKDIDRTNWGIYTSEEVTVDNNNNSAEGLEIEREVYFFSTPFISTEPEPDYSERNGVITRIVWRDELASGESKSYRYSIHYWMPITMIGFLICGLIALKRRIRRKTITKTGKKEDGEVTIFIEISNKTKQPIEQVEVIDFVPEMLKLKEEFDTLEPEEINETENGTKLNWKIEQMEPKESRILNYRIKSGLEVESEIILKGAEFIENGRKVAESEKVKANFPAKDST